MKYIKGLGFSFLALVLGGVGLGFVFSDLSQGESWPLRILIGALFFFIGGGAIGYFNPGLWVISGLTAWGGVLMGGLITLSAVRQYGGDSFTAKEPPFISVGLIMLILPITFSLIGGYIGKLLAQKRTKLVVNGPVT
jgi:peptidoglycan/LPS O-acetylase OafA/YrhL